MRALKLVVFSITFATMLSLVGCKTNNFDAERTRTGKITAVGNHCIMIQNEKESVILEDIPNLEAFRSILENYMRKGTTLVIRFEIVQVNEFGDKDALGSYFKHPIEKIKEAQ